MGRARERQRCRNGSVLVVVPNKTNAVGCAGGRRSDVLSATYAFFFSTSMPLKALCCDIVRYMSARRERYSLIQTFEAVGTQKLFEG
jgi:hypothetical protein